MLVVGFALGVVSRLLDRYTQNLGNMFSQLAIWILFGVLITLYSRSQKKAMGNVFFFCIGMLSTYYLVAWMTDGVYSEVMIVWSTVFEFCYTVLAFYLAHKGKRHLSACDPCGDSSGVAADKHPSL